MAWSTDSRQTAVEKKSIRDCDRSRFSVLPLPVDSFLQSENRKIKKNVQCMLPSALADCLALGPGGLHASTSARGAVPENKSSCTCGARPPDDSWTSARGAVTENRSSCTCGARPPDDSPHGRADLVEIHPIHPPHPSIKSIHPIHPLSLIHI